MSRPGSRVSRLLLDTSFLLPILGFETSAEITEAMPRLGRYIVYYSEISVLEAAWKIAKAVRGDEDIERVAQGLRALRDTFHRASMDERALAMALKMYIEGHRDVVDNLLYSAAVSEGMPLLTVDRELIRFVEEKGYPADYLITPGRIL